MFSLAEAVSLVKDVPLLGKRCIHFNHFKPEDRLSHKLNLHYKVGLVTAVWRVIAVHSGSSSNG